VIQIPVYEHESLRIGEKGFDQKHWTALVKLNQVHEGKYFSILHNGIKFNQHVGVVQIDGLQIQINPKADKDDDSNRWKNVLIPMLRACGRLSAESFGAANVKKQNLNLLEVYFEYYLVELEKLIRQGLVKKYRKETSNVTALKGKLEFSGNIRQNVVHQERFYTTHQVYDTNHKLHQVLRLALDIVSQFTHGTYLNDVCKRTQLAFPDTDKIKVNAQIFNAIKLDRKTAPYERAFELAKLIILNYSPDINQGSNKMIALLFDMNELWEEYVLKMLKIEIAKSNNDIEIIGQDSKAFWGFNRLKPDIVLKSNKQIFIIDTKWKRPGGSASVEDLRQVYAYARFWDAEKVMLLYPGDSSQNRTDNYRTKDFISTEHSEPKEIVHRAQMNFVNVINDKNELDEGIGIHILSKFGLALLESKSK
jgi:5-methylcytosine-specific restriction enzyme subunit McrC